MALPFYNQGDQDIYASGDHFIPQEQYRLNYTPSQIQASQIGNSGILNTQAANPYYYPQGGGGGGGGFNSTNKFGLNMDTMKTVSQGKYAEKGGPGNMYGGDYIQTDRQIAQDASGNWKDINTNQNVYHGNINVKTPGTMLLDKVFGKKTTGDPYKDSWYGEDFNKEDEEKGFYSKTIGPRNIIQRWHANKKIQKEQDLRDEIEAHNFAAAKEIGATRPQHHGDVSKNRGDHQAQSFRSEKSEGIDTQGGGMHGGKHYAQGGRISFVEGGIARLL